MKRAFFVVGPEASGTKMMRHALHLAGCYYDAPDWDDAAKDDAGHNFDVPYKSIVFHRSIPHGRWPLIWPRLSMLRQNMEQAGYTVQPLLMVRDWHATVSSQIKRKNIPTTVKEAEHNIREAIRTVSTCLPDFILVTYEAFCLNEKFRRWLFVERLNLPEPAIEIWYANDKHY